MKPKNVLKKLVKIQSKIDSISSDIKNPLLVAFCPFLTSKSIDKRQVLIVRKNDLIRQFGKTQNPD